MHVVVLKKYVSLRISILTDCVCMNRALSVGPELVPRKLSIYTYRLPDSPQKIAGFCEMANSAHDVGAPLRRNPPQPRFSAKSTQK